MLSPLLHLRQAPHNAAFRNIKVVAAAHFHYSYSTGPRSSSALCKAHHHGAAALKLQCIEKKRNPATHTHRLEFERLRRKKSKIKTRLTAPQRGRHCTSHTKTNTPEEWVTAPPSVSVLSTSVRQTHGRLLTHTTHLA